MQDNLTGNGKQRNTDIQSEKKILNEQIRTAKHREHYGAIYTGNYLTVFFNYRDENTMDTSGGQEGNLVYLNGICL